MIRMSDDSRTATRARTNDKDPDKSVKAPYKQGEDDEDDDRGKRMLANGFTPSERDVICARGKKVWHHPGNVRFREIIEERLAEYSAARSKVDKTLIVTSIVASIREASPFGGFVKEESGKWYEVGDHIAREKVGQSFRDLLHTKYRSSTKAKKRRRQGERDGGSPTFLNMNQNVAVVPKDARSQHETSERRKNRNGRPRKRRSPKRCKSEDSVDDIVPATSLKAPPSGLGSSAPASAKSSPKPTPVDFCGQPAAVEQLLPHGAFINKAPQGAREADSPPEKATSDMPPPMLTDTTRTAAAYGDGEKPAILALRSQLEQALLQNAAASSAEERAAADAAMAPPMFARLPSTAGFTSSSLPLTGYSMMATPATAELAVLQQMRQLEQTRQAHLLGLMTYQSSDLAAVGGIAANQALLAHPLAQGISGAALPRAASSPLPQAPPGHSAAARRSPSYLESEVNPNEIPTGADLFGVFSGAAAGQEAHSRGRYQQQGSNCNNPQDPAACSTRFASI